MMLLKRISTCLGSGAGYIKELVHDIYYKEDDDCIYALSPQDKKILDIYLFKGLRDEGIFVLDVEISIYRVADFKLNGEDRNAYMNCMGEYIIITEDNRVFREVEVDDDKWEVTYKLGEEWILLADKRKKKVYTDWKITERKE